MLFRIIDRMKGAYRFVRDNREHLPQAFDAIFGFGCRVSLLRGTLRGSRTSVAVLYIGRGKNYAYLLHAMFSESPEGESVEATLLTFRGAADRMTGRADVVVVDIGWPYHALVNRRRRYLEVPDWVNMVVELPQTWEGVMGRLSQSARRKARRNPYRSEITTSRDDIEHFYDEMYLPFVRRRFGDASIVQPRKQVVKIAMRGELLRVLRGDETVAAGVLFPAGDTLYFLWPGIPDAFADRPAAGAMDALYFFILRHAFDTGFRHADFYGTRPFLTDGVLQHKRRWGAAVEDAFSPSSLLIRPRNGSRAAARFCRELPVLARSEGRLEARFLCMDEPVDEALIRRLRRRFGCAGIDRMTVIALSGPDDRTDFREDDACECRVVTCTMDDFADYYVR